MKKAITCCLCGIASQLVWVQSFQAVTPSLLSSSRQPALSLEQTDLYRVHAQQYSNRLLSKGNGEEEPEAVFVEPGSEEFSKEQWAEIEEAQPSELSIMKDLLGINIFTYILAFLIIVFTGLNLTLGPGWLGGTLGIQGTGSIEEVSPSLPNTVDLNRDEYLL